MRGHLIELTTSQGQKVLVVVEHITALVQNGNPELGHRTTVHTTGGATVRVMQTWTEILDLANTILDLVDTPGRGLS